jgi:hypothetical protein
MIRLCAVMAALVMARNCAPRLAAIECGVSPVNGSASRVGLGRIA